MIYWDINYLRRYGGKNMAKKEKEELFEKETKYCKIIRSVELKDGDELFALEKIYIKALDRYEIRLWVMRWLILHQ